MVTRTARKSFKGGYIFKNFTGIPSETIVDAGIPPKAVFRLADAQGHPLMPAVKNGAVIMAGQVLGRATGRNAFSLLSSVSGTVESIQTVDGVKVVSLNTRDSQEWERIEAYIKTAGDPPAETIEAILAQSGIPDIPTRFGTAVIGAADVKAVIVNEVPADAYQASAATSLGARLPDLVRALRLLQIIYPAASIMVAAGKQHRQLVEQMQQTDAGKAIGWHFLEAKFPQQMDVMLMHTLLGRELSSGRSALQAGVLILDGQTALAVGDAVIHGKPSMERTVALCGPGFKENLHVRVRIGTPVADLVRSRLRSTTGWRLIENSLLLGQTIKDPDTTAVGQGTRTIIAVSDVPAEGFLPFVQPGLHFDSQARAFASSLIPLERRIDTNMHGEERACLNCGFCVDVCPARILPNILHRYVRRNIIDETILRYEIHHCIDCNLCSYVCVSKIDVARLMHEGKEKLRAEGFLEPSLSASAGGSTDTRSKEARS